MINKDKKDRITQKYTDRILDIINRKKPNLQRTFGFEYEFLSRSMLSRQELDEIYEHLLLNGFSRKNDRFISDSGMYITFEPGGQIEYCSSPLLWNDNTAFQKQLDLIKKTNSSIHSTFGIKYTGTDYFPGRMDAPLLLTSDRYLNLNERLKKSGTRGLEMMKGTASIHLHVVIRNVKEILPLFSLLRSLSTSNEFKMSSERRDIWNNLDSTRCGMPLRKNVRIDTSESLIKEMVYFAINAADIAQNIPFYKKSNKTFDGFLYHLTTIFTDIRLNLKGPTLELRTLGSMPVSDFEQKWKNFTQIFNNV